MELTQAVKALQQALRKELPDTPGVRIMSVPLSLAGNQEPLCWLNSQACWPQFYWQHRDGHEEYAVLCALRTFTSLAEGQRFLSCFPEYPELRLWGLNAFDPQHGQLFLPRLTWQRQGSQARLVLNLYSETSLREAAAEAESWLSGLCPAAVIPELAARVCEQVHLPAEVQWLALVTEATQAISRGQFDKVVLARATDVQLTQPMSPAWLMHASRQHNSRCYHFYMAFDSRQAFLGSSPERLWHRAGRQLSTEALAGTVGRDADDSQADQQSQWLLKDKKNQHENWLVVEDICQRLQAVAGQIDVEPVQVIRLRKVQHLHRAITATLNYADDTACLMQLQPTAAVAGLPRKDALAFIYAHEPFNRGWYAGSAGYLSLATSEFCVALRSALVQYNNVRLYAGAGIVAQSNPAEEWLEIENKVAALRSLFS
ncbi:isochorismate synthase MenF [Mangrovibacter plantisponsor]|uniref:Isochorismate synthase MenF n=1 Tax=Mangrovibacter plantisponsor TaxID=451513 RepID=A0A317Q3P0_9ENTR|nr:isochorismate synthase MenF [Mangrovibacter plantisponsor]PWW09603.1 isochorismate synthase [Mangrovibacter plantisponsor]